MEIFCCPNRIVLMHGDEISYEYLCYCLVNDLFNQTKFSIYEYLNPKVINDRAIDHHLIP